MKNYSTCATLRVHKITWQWTRASNSVLFTPILSDIESKFNFKLQIVKMMNFFFFFIFSAFERKNNRFGVEELAIEEVNEDD